MFQFKSPDKMFEIKQQYINDKDKRKDLFLSEKFKLIEEYFNEHPPTEQNNGSYTFVISKELARIVEIAPEFFGEIGTKEKLLELYMNKNLKDEKYKYEVSSIAGHYGYIIPVSVEE